MFEVLQSQFFFIDFPSLTKDHKLRGHTSGEEDTKNIEIQVRFVWVSNEQPFEYFTELYAMVQKQYQNKNLVASNKSKYSSPKY